MPSFPRVFAVPVFVVATIFALASSAHATSIQNNFGLVAPASEIDFSEIVLADQTELLNTYAGLGVTFAPGMRYNTTEFGIPNASAPSAVNFFNFVDPFDVFFNSPVTSAAMVIATNSGAPNTVLTALLNGVVVESVNITTSQGGANNFFGFTNINFNEIQISNPVSGIVVDNIQLGELAAVPEPASMLLLASGLGMIGARVRNRKKK